MVTRIPLITLKPFPLVYDMEEIQDCICVAQRRDSDGENRAVLFIKMKNGHAFTGDFRTRVEQRLAQAMWYECVPEVILEIQDIPVSMRSLKCRYQLMGTLYIGCVKAPYGLMPEIGQPEATKQTL